MKLLLNSYFLVLTSESHGEAEEGAADEGEGALDVVHVGEADVVAAEEVEVAIAECEAEGGADVEAVHSACFVFLVEPLVDGVSVGVASTAFDVVGELGAGEGSDAEVVGDAEVVVEQQGDFCCDDVGPVVGVDLEALAVALGAPAALDAEKDSESADDGDAEVDTCVVAVEVDGGFGRCPLFGGVAGMEGHLGGGGGGGK